MAGIGFELKRLYSKEGFTNKILASVQSLFVIFGPYLINILLMMLLLMISRNQGTNQDLYTRFMSILVYGFIYSQLITAGSSIGLTKFVSDQLYEKKACKIMYPFIASITGAILITFVLVFVVFKNIEIEQTLRLLIYVLYSLLIILRFQTVYLSALKNYKILSIIYLLCFIMIVPVFYGVTKLGLSSELYEFFVSFIIVLLVTVFWLMTVIFAMIPKQVNSLREYYRKFKKTRHVRLMNMLLTISIFGSVALYWMSPDATVYYSIFRTYPKYDYTFFIANISIIPAMIYFVVGVETKLFVQVRKFFDTLNGNFPLNDIELERKMLVSVIRKEVQVFTFVQLASTLSFLLIAYIFLGRSFSTDQLMVMSFYLFGTMLFVIIQIFTFILLYLAAFKEAAYIALTLFGVLLLTNGIIANFDMIEPALMLVYSTGGTLIVAVVILEIYLKNIYYNIYK